MTNNKNRRDFIKAVGATALVSATASGDALAMGQMAEHDSFDDISRVSLTSLPTTCRKMSNLTKVINGPDLYIKRDDVMELAHGGNKTRKLEFALAQALDNGAKAVITQGGLQSNHVRQTVSGAAVVGLEAHVILSNPVPEMKSELMGSGNYLMDVIMGAHIYVAEDGRGELVEKVKSELTAAGKKPYMIPAGASNGVGGLGYVNAGRELIGQWKEMGISPSHIFIATGSCGTHAGLLTGLRHFGNTTTKVVAVSVSSPAEALKKRVRQVMDMISAESGIDTSMIDDDEIIVTDDYTGQAYGYPSDEGNAAIKLVGEQEGILLDPVYTGKAMSGYIDMVKNNKLENAKDVVFLHTGGAPALHPYADYFLG
ncbi:MAG: D-cysteine desulfhydrase family protein [Kordiimonadaceae bacterium]|jgi:L-cysteate sulfo-lyase|nr:D-cysteine desulfhydrase family protein [Kordiimonadaceae bacterium]MBT6035267.1 D-cysteine desulfhydrase family protein [Kordiimonadaceae bacterium]MBT6328210.1 D-cysteine desulfhydrase family protein [Kordiimonadaceae bacterium]MBT7583092.1 D-cysteine desulfhydrase family protein [Kordiimonadaceae bacterium]